MEETDSPRLTAAAGRRFAWTLAGAFAVLGAIAWWRGRERVALIFGGLAVLFFIAGAAIPTKLGPIEAAWMGLAHAISRVTTPIFMGVVYFLVLTPTGLIRRAAGKGGFGRRDGASSFWVAHKRFDGEAARRKMERQF